MDRGTTAERSAVYVIVRNPGVLRFGESLRAEQLLMGHSRGARLENRVRRRVTEIESHSE